jgi:uncharacterized delta-60 repeat protein
MKRITLQRALAFTATLLVQFGAFLSNAGAATGDVDLSFDPGSPGSSIGPVHAIAVQPDGRIIVAGGTLARMNVDGSRDDTFTFSADSNMPIGAISSVALQADGKMLVGHEFGLTRLNPNGTLDTGFHAPSIVDYDLFSIGIRALALQPDGKILIGGFFRIVDATLRSGVARLNADGTLDASFVPATSDNEFAGVFSIAMQPDGKVLIGGQYMTVRIDSVARLNADGSLDDANFFAVKPSETVRSVALQPDGRIVMGGSFSGGIARLNVNGSVDATFNAAGAGADRGVLIVAVQPDGRVLAGGDFLAFNGVDRDHVARLNTDGTLDTAYVPGKGPYPSVLAIALLADGGAFIGGADFSGLGDVSPHDMLARLTADGIRDESFITEGTGVDGVVYSLLPQADGKVLISGGFAAINRTRLRGNNARLNADGSFDSTFDPGGPTGNIVSQPDGRIIIGGGSIYFSGQNRIVRFNTDGSVDTTFSLGSGANFPIHCVAALPDGKLLVGGGFQRINGEQCNGIARLNNDGSVDSTYTAEIFQFGNSIYAIVVQADGKALIGGEFTSADNTKRYGLARLNANGSLDKGFDHVAVSNDSPIDVRRIALQQDGRIIIGGYFFYVHGTRRDGIARLTASGALDTNFTPGTDFGAGPITLQADGKVLVGASGIVRLNVDGSLEDSFHVVTDGNVATIAVQPDGNILLGGPFNRVNGVIRTSVARVYGDAGGPPNTSPSVSITSPLNGATFVAPASVNIDVEASDSDGTVVRVDFHAGDTLVASDDSEPFQLGWDNVSAGTYLLTAMATDDLGATSTSAQVTIVVTAPPLPSAPSNLTARAISSNRIKLRWIDNATNETSYRVERSLKGTPFEQVAEVGANFTVFLDRGLKPNRRYLYRVRASNAGNDSQFSNTAKAKTPR